MEGKVKHIEGATPTHLAAAVISNVDPSSSELSRSCIFFQCNRKITTQDNLMAEQLHKERNDGNVVVKHCKVHRAASVTDNIKCQLGLLKNQKAGQVFTRKK